MTSSRSSLPSSREEERRFSQPFFWLVVISLLISYGYTVAFATSMHDPLRLIAFTALFLLTGALHWMLTALHLRPRGVIPYFIFQGMLAFVITLVGDNISLARIRF